jgi:F-type H+-transporting ATPase subunit delta
LYKENNKIESASVTTATPLDETLRAEVINFIKKHGNDNVELTEKVDENIIGGAIIRMGDKQLDASVSKTISELRQSFNSNLYLQDF